MMLAKAALTAMIDCIAEPDLSLSDEARIADLLRQCFPTDFGGRSFYQQRPHMRLVWRDRQILSHLSLFLRAIRLGDELVDVLGIGDVATAPDARGCGHATALLDHAVHKAGRARFAILIGDRTLYDRAGFVAQSNPFRHLRIEGARTVEITDQTSPFLRVRPLADSAWPKAERVDFLGPLF
ncbi:GNAT family N-acetyltransferase [Mameliella alba]|nr:GNAT family N-acetyltransferase [Mameliella alba]